MAVTSKTLNPKDALGRAKHPMHLWPATATALGALGFYEGFLKYGRVNWRASEVAASVYVAAAMRHIQEWFEGGELIHIGNALACLGILADAHANGTLVDDRQFAPVDGAYVKFIASLEPALRQLEKEYGDRKPKHWDRRDQKKVKVK